MPRLNDVFIVGLVASEPSIKYDKSENPVQAALEIIAVHGTRLYGDKLCTGNVHSSDIENKGYDNIWIHTKDPGLIEQFKRCKPYDIIEVKGCLRVTTVNKKAYCPECGEKHSYFSTRTTVYPIYFERRRDIASKYNVKVFDESVSQETEEAITKDALQYIKNCIEISNIIKLIGVICKDPQLYKRDTDNRIMMSFPMAVKRKYFVPEDDMRINVDFPYIKMYGKAAIEQSDDLAKGNLIMIDGFLQTRNIIRRIECEKCGIKFSVNDSVTEVVPYSIEYIRENIGDVQKKPEKTTGYIPQIIGSEADVDLTQKTPEESIDDNIAEGYQPDEDVTHIINSVVAMND